MSIARKLIPSGEETFPFKIQITTTASNTVWTTPLSDYGGLTPQVVIDWGDSTANSGLITSSSSINRIHTYVTPGTYTITISGFMPGFTVNNLSSIRSLVTGIIQFGEVGLRALNFYGCVNLTSIPSSASLSAVGGYDGLNEMRTFANFMRGTRITTFPSDMFQYSPNASTFSDAFSSIPTLTSVPSGVFDSNTAATTFASCFFGCTSLTSVPSTLFDQNIIVTNFSGTFRNCLALTNVLQFTYNTGVTIFNNCYNMSTTSNALTGTAPELWNRTPTPSGTDCFNNCTGLSNYVSIPLNFK
jgi:hypothetical protein